MACSLSLVRPGQPRTLAAKRHNTLLSISWYVNANNALTNVDESETAARAPDRDMLQRLLVARSGDEVALQPPSYLAWYKQPQNIQILFQMLPGKSCCRSIVER